MGIVRLITSSFCVAVVVTASAAHAEDLDPEKFYPVSVVCGAGDDVALTKANAAGRFVRAIRKDGVLLLQARNVETGFRFDTTVRTKVSEIAGLTDPEHRKWSERFLAQLDTLTNKICKGDEETRRRYLDVVLRDFRRKIGISAVPD